MRNRDVSLARIDSTGRFVLDEGHALSASPWVLYDGDCPFCSAFSSFARVSARLPGLRLLNARDGGPEAELVASLGLDLDQGMVLQHDGAIYYGRACMHRLSQLASAHRLPNKILESLMKPGFTGEALYRSFVRIRRATLFLLGRSRL